MEQSIKNAIIHHGTNLLELATMPREKLGTQKQNVEVLFGVLKAVVNGLKNDVDPAVLFNSIAENVSQHLSETHEEIADRDEKIDAIILMLKNMNEADIAYRAQADQRYEDAKEKTDLAMSKLMNVSTETKTNENNG